MALKNKKCINIYIRGLQSTYGKTYLNFLVVGFDVKPKGNLGNVSTKRDQKEILYLFPHYNLCLHAMFMTMFACSKTCVWENSSNQQAVKYNLLLESWAKLSTIGCLHQGFLPLLQRKKLWKTWCLRILIIVAFTRRKQAKPKSLIRKWMLYK